MNTNDLNREFQTGNAEMRKRSNRAVVLMGGKRCTRGGVVEGPAEKCKILQINGQGIGQTATTNL